MIFIVSALANWSLVVNIVLAFHIGSDLESVIGDPIGQPMATVSN